MAINEHYKTESVDTSIEAEQVMLEIAGRRTVAEKFKRVCELMEYLQALAFAATRKRNPMLSDEEIRFRLTAQRLGPELTLEVYGRLPDEDAR